MSREFRAAEDQFFNARLSSDTELMRQAIKHPPGRNRRPRILGRLESISWVRNERRKDQHILWRSL